MEKRKNERRDAQIRSSQEGGEPVDCGREFLLSEEILLVRNSGEIPEVALHGSLYYLTLDPEGPGMNLTGADRALLEEQVEARYREIIQRDLTPENRDRPIYRGLTRAAANWRRLAGFCRKTARDASHHRRETANSLKEFLARELAEVRAGSRRSSVNCTAAFLADFAGELGLAVEEMEAGCKELCVEQEAKGKEGLKGNTD